ncbi:MAG: glutathione S-transferase family protein [Pseudomonadota bacterium]
MKLWSGTLSPFSAKVRLALAEKGLRAELAEIPWSRATLWGPKPEAFLAVSSKGEVPALEDGALAVVDSTVINEYLEDAFPAPPLMPADAAGKAACRGWEDRADTMMAMHVTTLIQQVFMIPDPADRDAAAVDEAMTAFASYLDDLEAALGDREYLCGTFSLADIATWICLLFAGTLGVDSTGHTAVQAWSAGMSARPVFAAELESIMGAAAAA